MSSKSTVTALSLGALIGAGIAVAILYLGAKAGSVTIAVISAGVCVWYVYKAIRADREKMRRGRDAIWQRRIMTERRLNHVIAMHDQHRRSGL